MHRFDQLGARLRRIAIVQPVDAGEDHQMLRLDHLRDLGGQPIIVADANLLGGDRVVFVDDRQDVGREQAVDGVLGVEEARVILKVTERDQDLRDIEPVLVTDMLVRVEQQRHAAGRRRLLVAQARRVRRCADHPHPQRYRSGRAQHHLIPFFPQQGDVFQDLLHDRPARCEPCEVGEKT